MISKAEVIFVIAVVALIAGFVLPEAMNGIENVDDEIGDNSYITGITSGLVILMVISLLLGVLGVVYGVVKSA